MKCNQCPRACNVDRESAIGFCGVPWTFRVARAALHQWEEPQISGARGSGTIFFSGCNLRCVYCQNRAISRGAEGRELDGDALLDVMLRLEAAGAHNINLVTPTQYAMSLVPVLKRAKSKLHVPIVYNCGGYESLESLRALEGLVDIYLPDFKYADPALAKTLSNAEDYVNRVVPAITEMVRQVGPPQWEGEKLKKGVIIRHLILPGYAENSLKVLDIIGERFGKTVLVSLMRQYTPVNGLPAPLDRPVSEDEYQSVLSWMFLNDLDGFTQEAESATESFIPEFQKRTEV